MIFDARSKADAQTKRETTTVLKTLHEAIKRDSVNDRGKTNSIERIACEPTDFMQSQLRYRDLFRLVYNQDQCIPSVMDCLENERA